ncbi:GntR family transcriptional regulator [Nonomuraea basaltis]|nr:GntR family transcriptional regulator [Nonomuraea basaltis]
MRGAAVAARLGVSPTTVSTAYRELRLRGVVATEAGRGTRVVWRPPLVTPAAAHARTGLRDLASGNPDPELPPSLRSAVQGLDPDQPLYGAPTVLGDGVRAGARRRRRVRHAAPAVVRGARTRGGGLRGDASGTESDGGGGVDETAAHQQGGHLRYLGRSRDCSRAARVQ